jgi:hypothetical protein
MVKQLCLIGLLIIFSVELFAAEPLVLNDSKMPLKFVVDTIPAAVSGRITVPFKYHWEGWNKTEFEEHQNAAGRITYKVQYGSFAGGSHNYGPKIKHDIQEQGVLDFGVGSNMGEGRLFISVFCEYKGKDGKKHKGKIGSTYLSVNFSSSR